MPFAWQRPLGSSQRLVRRPYRTGRILHRERQMVLLHGFIKKTQKTPTADIEMALKRKKDIT